MNTLFNTMFENEEANHCQNGVHLRPLTYDLQESNVHLKLTIVDTVGFGDQINKDDRYLGLNGGSKSLGKGCHYNTTFSSHPDNSFSNPQKNYSKNLYFSPTR